MLCTHSAACVSQCCHSEVLTIPEFWNQSPTVPWELNGCDGKNPLWWKWLCFNAQEVLCVSFLYAVLPPGVKMEPNFTRSTCKYHSALFFLSHLNNIEYNLWLVKFSIICIVRNHAGLAVHERKWHIKISCQWLIDGTLAKCLYIYNFSQQEVEETKNS